MDLSFQLLFFFQLVLIGKHLVSEALMTTQPSLFHPSFNSTSLLYSAESVCPHATHPSKKPLKVGADDVAGRGGDEAIADNKNKNNNKNNNKIIIINEKNKKNKENVDRNNNNKNDYNKSNTDKALKGSRTKVMYSMERGMLVGVRRNGRVQLESSYSEYVYFTYVLACQALSHLTGPCSKDQNTNEVLLRFKATQRFVCVKRNRVFTSHQARRECVFQHDFEIQHDAYEGIYHDVVFKSSLLCHTLKSVARKKRRYFLMKNKIFLNLLTKAAWLETKQKVGKVEAKIKKTKKRVKSHSKHHYTTKTKIDVHLAKLLKKQKRLQAKMTHIYKRVLRLAHERCQTHTYLATGHSRALVTIAVLVKIPNDAKFIV